MIGFLMLAALVACANAQWEPNVVEGRSVMVHLFEWKWKDIANECETFLSPKNYGGVQVSPPSENLAITQGNRPWWERYQPVSYKLVTRSGNEEEFRDMVKRCNAAGIRIYVDAVFNHMTGTWSGMGTTGDSTADTANYDYPGVPYTKEHFHTPCTLNNYQDANNIRNCELSGLHDLDQSQEYVRGKIVDYLNTLIDAGVAGFRVDAAKHMWPSDLQNIYSRLNNLNTEHGFAQGLRPFIYQEVIDPGTEAVSKNEYLNIGRVTEFYFGQALSAAVMRKSPLKDLSNFGEPWGMVAGMSALSFVDNHDNQRGHGGAGDIITHKSPKMYKIAVAFMLAYNYGLPRVMSSYEFSSSDEGPPQDSSNNIISPTINADGSCASPWVCEHRWRQIYNMAEFRNVVGATGVTNWWSGSDWQIAFCRGTKGFIAINDEESSDLKATIQTCLPAGTYCDVISGEVNGMSCTGKSVVVGEDGTATIEILASEDDGVLAIHEGSLVGSNSGTTAAPTSGTTATTATTGGSTGTSGTTVSPTTIC